MNGSAWDVPVPLFQMVILTMLFVMLGFVIYFCD